MRIADRLTELQSRAKYDKIPETVEANSPAAGVPSLNVSI